MEIHYILLKICLFLGQLFTNHTEIYFFKYCSILIILININSRKKYSITPEVMDKTREAVR